MPGTASRFLYCQRIALALFAFTRGKSSSVAGGTFLVLGQGAWAAGGGHRTTMRFSVAAARLMGTPALSCRPVKVFSVEAVRSRRV